MPNLGSQFFDPFEDYENIEFEHHGEGWAYDEEDAHAPITHGSIHIPGRRIPVRGTWMGLSAPEGPANENDGRWSGARPTREWEDFRFHALSEVPNTDWEDMSSPFMDLGVMLSPNFTPERDKGSGASASMAVAGRPIGVDLPAFGGDPAGYYPVEPPHSKVHTEGFWLGGRRGDLDLPEAKAVGPPDPGAAPHRREEDRDFPEGEQVPTNLSFGYRGPVAHTGGLAAMKKVERWAQDPGGAPLASPTLTGTPAAPEFGTHTTDWVRERDLRNYHWGSREVAARSKAVVPMEQLTSPEGVSTLSSATGKGFDYYTREMERYMEHLRGDDDFFEQGTQGQPGLEEPEETETAKQIKGALGGIAEGLAAAFAPKKAPPKQERPVIKMDRPVVKMKDPYEAGTEGMWNRALYRSYGDTGPFSFQKGQPGQVDFREGIVRPKHAAGKSFSSEEIEDMSDTQYRSVLADAANIQRGLPEHRMNQIQATHSGLYGFAAEHIGDISHRMGQSFATEDQKDYDLHYPHEKLRKTTSTLNHPYGFEREHAEQITENVNYYQNLGDPDRKYPPKHPTTVTTEEYTQKLDAAGEAYSQAHEALPAYNAPMAKARDTAVSLGRQQFDEVREGLAKMNYMTASQSRHNTLMGQGGAVRWLKGQGR